MYISKNTFNRHVESFSVEDEGKSRYVLFKGFNKFMYNQTLHCD